MFDEKKTHTAVHTKIHTPYYHLCKQEKGDIVDTMGIMKS